MQRKRKRKRKKKAKMHHVKSFSWKSWHCSGMLTTQRVSACDGACHTYAFTYLTAWSLETRLQEIRSTAVNELDKRTVALRQ